MTVKTYNSLVRDFVNMADAMNRARSASAYDYARNGGHDGETQERTARLPLDVWTTDEAFTIKAYLPGVDVEDVEITFEGEELSISGSYPELEGGEKVEYTRRELYHGKFARTLTFNVDVNADEIEATFENGILTLSVPKAEEVQPKRIAVQAR